MATKFKPGQKASASGQYEQLGPRGGIKREVTVTKGEPLPPAPQKNCSYRLVDRTKNKSGMGK
jgi:hypothetical protein